MSRVQSVEIVAALCGIIWFVWIIDACFTWFFSWSVRYVIGSLFVLFATVQLKGKGRLVLTKQRRLCFLLILILILLQTVNYRFIALLCYGPLALILLWDDQTLLRLYKYLKRFIVFYAIVSVFVEFLVLTDTWRLLPHIELPPQDIVQENLNTTNLFFGLFVIPQYGSEIFYYRAMGPLREGGHFSIFLGIIYFIERCVHHKGNIWIFAAGLLTLSPNFVFFFLIAEGYLALAERRIAKFMLQTVGIVMFITVAIWFSPNSIKDAIVQVVLERSLQENVGNMESGGFMALLEGRTDIGGEQMYEKFVNRAGSISKLKGLSKVDEDIVLSDFRLLIIHYGYLGMMLFVIISYYIGQMSRKLFYGLCVSALGLYVMISRAWMFQQGYIWLMMVLASITFYCKNAHYSDVKTNQ